jgi:hypothetical protein
MKRSACYGYRLFCLISSVNKQEGYVSVILYNSLSFDLGLLTQATDCSDENGKFTFFLDKTYHVMLCRVSGTLRIGFTFVAAPEQSNCGGSYH